MSGAGEALAAAALAALAGTEGLNGAYDGPPLTAAFPHAVVELGPESDWSHKSGVGRELRLALLIRDKSERPVRLRALAEAAAAQLAAIGPVLDGWRLVNLVFLRMTAVRDKSGMWTAAIEYRARLLRS